MSLCCTSKSCTAVIRLAKGRYCKSLCVFEILDCSRSWKAHYFKYKRTQMAWMCHQSAWALKLLVFLSWVLHIFLSFNMYLLLSLAPSSDLLHLGASERINRRQPCSCSYGVCSGWYFSTWCFGGFSTFQIFFYVLNRLRRISSQSNNRVPCWPLQDIPRIYSYKIYSVWRMQGVKAAARTSMVKRWL